MEELFKVRHFTGFEDIQADFYVADLAPLQEEAAFQKGLLLIPEDRRAQITGLRFPELRIHGLGAWLLARKALAERGIDLNTCTILEEEKGKPYLEGRPAEFNLSHSGGYAACAVCREPIGIDIEMNARLLNHARCIMVKGTDGDSFLRRICTQEELQFLQSQKDSVMEPQMAALLTGIWTRKEAFAKACGIGLGIDFRTINTMQNDRYMSTGNAIWQVSISRTDR